MSRSVNLLILVVAAAGCFSSVYGGVREGIEVPYTTTPPAVPSRSVPLVADVIINFDYEGAPCVFYAADPLRAEYEAQGVSFSGASAADGGAILNECSNFDVTGYSSPNFLAFNSAGVMMNGGCPCTPEILEFPSPVITVSALVGSGNDNTGTIEMAAFNPAGELLDADTVEVYRAMQRLSVTGCTIVRVVINQHLENPAFALDDLAFTFGASATSGSTWGRVKALFN